MRLRGGGSHDSPEDEYRQGDDSYFSARPQPKPRRAADLEEPAPPPAPRPFHRTPTGLSTKQLKRRDAYEVDLEGGLDICLNVEVSAKDPSGITVPYRLLVPRLFYEYEGEEATTKEPSAFRRFLSFRKRKGPGDMGPESEYEEDDEEEIEGRLGSAGVGR